MDRARLRANARELRTFVTELGAANRAYDDRITKEIARQIGRSTPFDFEPTDDERLAINQAQSRLLGNLAKHFLALTEELAGDIDQDMTTWKPPSE